MPSRRRSAPQESQTVRDAKEFGVGVRCGGWRLGLLVARNVTPGKAGRPAAEDNRSPENDSEPVKLSMNKFAELAGVSVSHVKYYYDAWELASKASLVPSAGSIQPGDEDIDVEADSIEVDDNPRTHWTHFYNLAKNPPKPEKKVDNKEDSKPVAEDDEDSDDDEVDEDFGLALSKDEVAEADSQIQRNELLEIMETISSVQSRLSRVGTPVGENDALLGQISSAALDLSTTANAIVAQKDVPVEA
jgi:hypothetical protein